MKNRTILILAIVLGVIILGVFGIAGNLLNGIYNKDGGIETTAYNVTGDVVFSSFPIPTGNLTADETVPLPDLYEVGKGFTCTGLAYDQSNNTFLVGDIGILQSGGTIQSQLVRLSADFETVVGTIPLYTIFPSISDVQGVTIDTSDNTIWVCSPSPNKIYHLNSGGTAIGSIDVARPTGVAYSCSDDTLWVLTYDNNILHIQKNGTVLATYSSTFGEALDQCFLDEEHGYLYITAGTNYSSRNNVYRFDISTHEQSIACTVDSYSVEGIWIGADRMVIVNDGYYHSAVTPVNQTNIYLLR